MTDPGGASERPPSLPFDAELRIALGLDLDERISLRARGARMILLERSRPGDVELPADRELALCVDVRAFPLSDVFAWIHAAGKSGLLAFSNDDHAKQVWLHRGEVVFAASNQRIDRLGHSMVRSGALTLEQLRDVERGYRRGERFGKALVERGLVTPRELWSGLQRQVEEIVRSLFSYRAGLVYFWDGDVQPDNVVRLELPTQRLVEEGKRFREELARFVAALADPRVRIAASPGRRESTSGAERLLFDALSEESPFGPLCRRVGLDEPTVARTLQLLHRAGVVRIRRASEDPDLTLRVRRGDPGEKTRTEVREALRLLAALVEPIVVAEGAAAIRERFAAVIEGVGARFPGLLEGIEPRSDATLDPDPILERALAAESVGASAPEALGALIDYLEFELKNHPGVDDAALVLAEAASARAKFGL